MVATPAPSAVNPVASGPPPCLSRGQPEPPAQYIDTRRGAGLCPSGGWTLLGPCSDLAGVSRVARTCAGQHRAPRSDARTHTPDVLGRLGVGHRGAGQRSDREPGAMLGRSGLLGPARTAPGMLGRNGRRGRGWNSDSIGRSGVGWSGVGRRTPGAAGRLTRQTKPQNSHLSS